MLNIFYRYNFFIVIFLSFRFRLLERESIEFKGIGLRDNVAQLLVFEVQIPYYYQQLSFHYVLWIWGIISCCSTSWCDISGFTVCFVLRIWGLIISCNCIGKPLQRLERYKENVRKFFYPHLKWGQILDYYLLFLLPSTKTREFKSLRWPFKPRNLANSWTEI